MFLFGILECHEAEMLQVALCHMKEIKVDLYSAEGSGAATWEHTSLNNENVGEHEI